MAKITQEMIAHITEAIGGASNVVKSGNCMTRLRLTLKENALVDTAKVKAISGVLGVIETDEQLQIVLGPGKAQAAADMMAEYLAQAPTSDESMEKAPEASLKEIAASKKREVKSKQSSAIHNFLSKFATIFTPLIPGFIAAGLLLGIATLIEQSVVQSGGTVTGNLLYAITFMKVFSKGLFAFLSIMIGYNAQQAFGGTGVNGAIIAALFILGYDPKAATGIYSGMETFFGLTIVAKGNIIGVLIATIVGAYVERQVRKIIPGNLDMILTSGITLLIMGTVTFVAIMPFSGLLFNGMSWLFLHLNSNPIGCAVLAGLFLIAVMFGIHQGFIPVYFALMDAQGFNSLFPILSMAGAGQVGASLALYFKAPKDSVLRMQIRGAIIPGILGVGEPLIYGVTLPRIKPFITACIGGAIGGFFIGTVAYLGLPMGLNSAFGPSGIVALPLMTSNHGIFAGMAVYGCGLLVSYFAGFIITWFFGTKDVDLA